MADDRKRTNSFHDSDLEREAVNSCAHGIDEAVEWRRVRRRAHDLARQREAVTAFGDSASNRRRPGAGAFPTRSPARPL